MRIRSEQMVVITVSNNATLMLILDPQNIITDTKIQSYPKIWAIYSDRCLIYVQIMHIFIIHLYRLQVVSSVIKYVP